MDAAKYLEIIGCEVKKPSRFQVDYKIMHHGKRYDFINGLVLSNWTVYHPNDKDEPGNLTDSTVYEFSEKEMKNYIYENFIDELRDTQIDKILK